MKICQVPGKVYNDSDPALHFLKLRDNEQYFESLDASIVKTKVALKKVYLTTSTSKEVENSLQSK